MTTPTPTAQDGERERLVKDLRNRQTVIDKRAAGMIESQSAELSAMRAQVDGLRGQANIANWRADANHIHETVVKAWPAWSDEDKRFLALAMSGEVGELLNHIKKDWRGDDGDRSKGIIEELVDVRIYLHLLATAYGVDLDRACNGKIPELYRRWPEAKAALAPPQSVAKEKGK